MLVTAVCTQCDAGVKTCSANGPGGALTCGTDPNSNTQLYLDPTNTCVHASDCPLSTFVDTTNNKCSACGTGAFICNSTTDAVLCGPVNDQPTYLNNGICLTNATVCQSGTYANSTSKFIRS